MTIVELFSKTPINNVISTLANRPERVVFVGESSKMKRFEPIFKRFLAATGIETQVEYRKIHTHELHQIVDVLEQVVRDYPNCHFDLTGGDDLSLAAIGVIYERYRTQGVELHQYNVNTGKVYDCDLNGVVASGEIPPLTVEQDLILHGGSRVREGEDWDLTEEFIRDVWDMWDISRKNCGRWNFQTTILMEMMQFNKADSDSGLDVEVVISRFEDYLAQQGRNYYLDLGGIFCDLEIKGLISDLHSDFDVFSLTFKNEQIKRCLTKAGTILEMVVYLAASELKQKNDEPLFTDVETGVYIDWDGGDAAQTDLEAGVKNEIDVMLMRGLVPVFISCKNGTVRVSELYKLNTVAERFGRGYAKKVLLVTNFGNAEATAPLFRQRAKEMDIQVIEGVQEMTEETLKSRLRSLA